MKFGPVPLGAAEGATLVHAQRTAKGTVRKGRVLTGADVARLRAAGLDSVVVARYEPGDVPEDPAAARLAACVAGSRVRAGRPFTGRVNLHATCRGLLIAEPAGIDRLNALDEAFSISTLPAHARVEAGQLIATVKIVPFSVHESLLDRASAAAVAPLSIARFSPRSIALIQTRLAGTRDEVLAKTERVTRARVADLGSPLGEAAIVDHETDAVAAALVRTVSAGASVVLVIGASATVDRRDVIPAALERAGGQLIRYGMPVDPGNLLVLGSLGAATVLGLPGSARSPRRSGFDEVLGRLAAGRAVSAAAIASMGVGGLLKEVRERPQPRLEVPGAAPVHAPRVAALVLAGGRSTRMGEANKLLAEIGGRPMVRHVVETALASAATSVTVVTGHQDAAVRAALASLPVSLVHNPDFAGGLSTSLTCGVAALAPAIDGVLVCLGDMPGVSTAVFDALIGQFDPGRGATICVPTHAGRRGNPVLWGRRWFPDLLDLAGDAGARRLLEAHRDELCEVAVDEAGVLVDIDSPAALADYRGGLDTHGSS